MRNLLKLIKNLSFLLCFGFGLNYMVVPVMAKQLYLIWLTKTIKMML